MNYIIGAGGVGSWLCPSLCKLVGPESIVVIDGDMLEEKNLDRQLYDIHFVGCQKSRSLSERYHCNYHHEWYNLGLIAHNATDWLFVCVDNDPARLSAIEACDQYNCSAIIAANETTSAEAYIYLPSWRGTKRDPRVMYPELATNKDNDPQRASIGCTGKAQESNRQLVSANFMAAALAQHLYVLWGIEFMKLEDSAGMMAKLPHKLVANLSNLESVV